MNPSLPLLLFMLAGLKISLGGCHLFLASLMITPHLLFCASMLDYRSRLSNSGLLSVKARDHERAAMQTRSMPGCGTLAGPSINLKGFLSQKKKGSAEISPESQGPKHPRMLGRPGRPRLGSSLFKKSDAYTQYVPVWYIPITNNCCVILFLLDDVTFPDFYQ